MFLMPAKRNERKIFNVLIAPTAIAGYGV